MKIEIIAAVIFIVTCAIFDLKRKEIPVYIIIMFGILSIILVAKMENRNWHVVLYSLIPGAALLALSLCTKESIGYGDGFVVLVLGALIGFSQCLSSVLLGFLLLSVWALVLLVFRKVTGKSKLPYIPFLAIGLGVVIFG